MSELSLFQSLKTIPHIFGRYVQTCSLLALCWYLKVILPGNGHQCHDCDGLCEGFGRFFVHDPVSHATGVLRDSHLT